MAALARFETRFATIDSRSLSRAAAIDLELVNGDIRARRLELERIRSWEKNPDRYSSAVTQSVYAIMSRRFAPPAERLRSVIARERRIPSVFADARDNLVNPPRVYTEVAIDQLPGIIGFFHSDVPRAFDAVKDPALLAEFRAANQAVIEALEKYQSFLTTKLLPRSKGDFRIGADNYRKKLLYEERVDLPLDRLLQIGWDDLRANQRRFKETALKLDPKSTPAADPRPHHARSHDPGPPSPDLPRPAERHAALHRRSPHRHHSLARCRRSSRRRRRSRAR